MSLVFNIIFKFLPQKSDKKKKWKESNLEGEVKLSLFAHGMLLHIESPQDDTREVLELSSEYGKVAG